MKLRTATIALVLAGFACMVYRAAAKPPTQPAEYIIGEMHLQTLPVINYLYGGTETTFDKIAEPVRKMLPPLLQGAGDGQIHATGPILFIYQGVKEDMTKPFVLQIGLPVTDASKPFGEFKVRKTEPFRCATMLYTGPLMHVSKVYEKLMAAASAGGLTPTGEAREFYLYWENADSPNNVIQIQIGIK